MPHVVVQLTVTIDGTEYTGMAADHAVPKWFRKDPTTSPADDIEAIIEAIEHACESATQIASETAFDFWRQVSNSQQAWGDSRDLPALLTNFGTTFVERAVIEAVCRHAAIPFPAAVRKNVFGVEPGQIYPETNGMTPADAIPNKPRSSIAVRHTVGKTDPLTDDDVDEPRNDGLPETLSAYLDRDGIRYVKCKLGGDPAEDLDRLRRIAAILDTERDDYGVTLDANEQYGSIDDLRALRRGMESESEFERFLENLICIEQPFDRHLALSPAVGEMLDRWDGAPIIVDESDAAIDTLGRALDLGYHGTSVKSCKGVFKGLVNACLVAHRASNEANAPLLTAEDLSTIGPVSLQADLALIATLGFGHVERNGHHYFRGGSGLPAHLQEGLLDGHGDLYRRHSAGFPTLDVDDGDIRCDSVLTAPFGRSVDVDLSAFTPASQWSVDELPIEA